MFAMLQQKQDRKGTDISVSAPEAVCVSLPFPDYAVNTPFCYNPTLVPMDLDLELEKKEEVEED